MELDHCSYKIWPYAGTPGESDATRREVGGSDNAFGAGNQQERPGSLDPGILRDYTPDTTLRSRDEIVRSPRRRGELGRNDRAPDGHVGSNNDERS